MNADFWVRISATKKFRQWAAGRIETFKKKPTTTANQIAVNIQINVPDAFFETPQFQAVIDVPEDAVTAREVRVEVADNIAQLISEQLGVRVHVAVPEADGD